ncbi:hypothetical protein [Microtetraspora glauca]|uniref:Uncharacterized protein n=1 Tax=Microtetraspora glauca TaxID=1996 RepID=A0ABV3G6N8_MICGL
MTTPGNGYYVRWVELQRQARAVGERLRANAATYAAAERANEGDV